MSFDSYMYELNGYIKPYREYQVMRFGMTFVKQIMMKPLVVIF